MLELVGCEVDLRTGTVVGGAGVTLTDRERSLLAYLSSRPSVVVSRDALLTEVWGYSSSVVTRVVDTTVRRLREKIEVNPDAPRHVLTVHGTGYRFEPVRGEPVEALPAPSAARRVVLADRIVDLDAGVVTGSGGTVALTGSEVDLLTMLADRSGGAVDLQLLGRRLGTRSARAVQSRIHRLRAKIEVNPSEPQHLLTVGRTGYRLALPSPTSARSRVVLVQVALIEAPVAIDGSGELGRATSRFLEALARGAHRGGGIPVGDGWCFAFDDAAAGLRFAAGVPAEGREVAIHVRAGVHRGSVVMTPDPLSGRVALHGADAHRADELARHASAGQVWIDAALWAEAGVALGIEAVPVGHGAVAIGSGVVPGAPTAVLPSVRGRFVGRHAELDALRRSLGADHRLITLVGAPGVGKSRLALEALTHSTRPGGAFHLALGSVAGADEVLAAVAGALGIEFVGNDPAAQVTAALCAHPALVLWLDDVDTARTAVRQLIEGWLASGAPVHVVATSRRALEVAGEHVVAVEPMPRDDAMALFLDRAASDVALGDPDVVEALVEQLEGLPLALELGAARTAALPVAEILARMPDRLRLLTRPAGEGTRSLAAALDVSWALLDRDEAAALTRCSVFRGGFALDAAEAVLAGLTEAWPVDLVEALVRHHLLRIEGERWVMLDAVRVYAARRLAEDAGAERAAEEAHGRWYAQLGARDEFAALTASDGRRRLDRIAREVANLDHALTTAVAHGDGETAGGAALAHAWLRRLRGPIAPGLAALERALSIHSSREAELHLVRGALHAPFGDAAAAESDFGAALRLAAGAGDAEVEALVHTMSGSAFAKRLPPAEVRARHERAVALVPEPTTPLGRRALLYARFGAARSAPEGVIEALESVLALARRYDDPLMEGNALGQLAIAERERGRHAKARERCEACLAVHRAHGYRHGEALARGSLAVIVRYEDSASARAHAEASRALHRRNGHRVAELVEVGNLGVLSADARDFEVARRALTEAVDLAVRIGMTHLDVTFRSNLGRVLFELGRLAEARDELTRASALADSLGSPRLIATVAIMVSATSVWPDTEVLAVVDRALDLQPQVELRVTLEVRRSRLLHALGRDEDARQAVERVDAQLAAGADLEPDARAELEAVRSNLGPQQGVP